MNLLKIFSPLILSAIFLGIAVMGYYLDKGKFQNPNKNTPRKKPQPEDNFMVILQNSGGLEDESKFEYENFRSQVISFFFRRYHNKRKKN